MEGIIQNQKVYRRKLRFQDALVRELTSGPFGEKLRILWKQSLGRFDSFSIIAVAGFILLCSIAIFSFRDDTAAPAAAVGAVAPLVLQEELSLPDDDDVLKHLSAFLAGKSGMEEEDIMDGPVPTVLSSVSWREYTVVPGDTVSEIAKKAGISMSTVISFNRLRNARSLMAGQTLRLPSMDGVSYTVRRGDSLSGIAGTYGISLNDLLDANNLTSAVIQPGQELFIPGISMKSMELKKALGELFRFPSKGRLTSGFGMRNDPFTGVRRFHYGIDLASSTGSPVTAAMDGKVAMVSTHPTYGKYVIIQHADGYQTWYAHLNEWSVGAGQRVTEGQKVGEVGSTGYSTGPHLHFAIFRRGQALDPLKYLY